MLKKSITFTDLNGETVTEDHFFHLSKADMVELELSEQGGLSKKLEQIVEANDGNLIMQTFKDLLLRSYGKKSEDGRNFKKTQDLRDEFQSSEAYSALFMELVTNPDAAAKFVEGIVPADLNTEMEKIVEARRQSDSELLKPGNVFENQETTPAQDPPPGTPRVISRSEARELSGTELSHLLATGQAVLGDEE